MRLDDVIDVELWTKAQDKFASFVSLPTVTVDNSGKELISSLRPPVFCQLLTSKIKDKCVSCRAYFVDKLKNNPDKIVIYKCHCGLLNILVPIIASGKQVAAVVCGPIVEPGEHIHKCKRLGEEANFKSILLFDALKQMRIINRVNLEKYATLLHMLSQTVPDIVREKYISDKKISELNALQNISAVLNSTFNMNVILKSIIDFMKDFMDCSGCSIIIHKNSERFSSLPNESFLLDFEKNMTEKAKDSGKVLLIKDLGDEFKEIKSVLILPLYIREEIVGVINLYRNSEKELSEETMQFLSIFSDQVAMAIQNAQQYKELKLLSITDKLTGLYNRRHFMKVLENEVERCKRSSLPLSVAFIDIDNFGAYNNNEGHLAGDYALSTIASLIKTSVRRSDTVGRYGGEEFIVVMPDTSPAEAAIVLERARESVELEQFENQEQQPNGNLTISIGVATYDDDFPDTTSILKKADEKLYYSKNTGKNKVSSFVFEKEIKDDVEIDAISDEEMTEEPPPTPDIDEPEIKMEEE